MVEFFRVFSTVDETSCCGDFVRPSIQNCIENELPDSDEIFLTNGNYPMIRPIDFGKNCILGGAGQAISKKVSKKESGARNVFLQIDILDQQQFILWN